MTNEEIERELGHLASKEDLAQLRAEMHKSFGEQTRWFVVMMGVQTTIILGAIYFMQLPYLM